MPVPPKTEREKLHMQHERNRKSVVNNVVKTLAKEHTLCIGGLRESFQGECGWDKNNNNCFVRKENRRVGHGAAHLQFQYLGE
jgi:hypothetical protein